MANRPNKQIDKTIKATKKENKTKLGKSARLKRIQLSYDALVTILMVASEHALPSDAKAHTFYSDPSSNSFFLVFSSNEFAEVSEGEIIPQHEDPVLSQDIIQLLRGKNGRRQQRQTK